jgi:hypothetical protein
MKPVNAGAENAAFPNVIVIVMAIVPINSILHRKIPKRCGHTTRLRGSHHFNGRTA